MTFADDDASASDATREPRPRAWPVVRAADPPRDVLLAEDDPETLTVLRNAARLVFPGALLHVLSATRRLSPLLATLRPDFLVVSLDFLEPSPADVIAAAQAREPRTRVVVVASHGEDDRLFPALRGAAAGFLFRRDELGVAVNTLRDAQAGVLPISPVLARQALRHADAPANGVTLRASELELLGWIAAGDTLAQAAERMGAHPTLLRAYVQRIYEKLKLCGYASPVGAPGQA